MRRLAWGLPLLLAGALVAAAAWLGGSNGGARWLVGDLAPRLVGGLRIQGVEGTLWDGLRIARLRYADGTGLAVEIERLSWRWDLARLRERLLRIRRLSAARVKVTPGRGGAQPDRPRSGFALPLAVELPEARIARFEWAGGEGAPLVLTGLHAGLRLDRSLTLHVLEGELAEPPVKARLSGEVGIDQAGLPLRLAVAWEARLPLAGETVSAAGRGELQGELDRLELQHALSRPFSLSTRGQLRGLAGARPALDLAGAWERLQWPLGGDPQIASRAGSYRISGPLEALDLQISARLQAPDLPPGEASLLGRWEGGRLRLAPLRLVSAAGRLSAVGSVDLRQAPSWSVELTGDALDPSPLAADWPGRLALRAASRGRVENGGVSGRLQIESLQGTLRGYPFAASGGVEIEGDRIALHALRLRSGTARLAADGSVSPALGLQLSGDVPDLQTLLPQASGRLKFDGEASGRPVQPRLSLHLEGQALAHRTLRLGGLRADIDWRPPGQGEGSARLEVTDLSVAGRRWQRIGLDLEGSPERHRLALTAQGGPVDAQLRLGGIWREATWRGRIEQLTLDQARLGRWSATAPAGLSASATRVRLDPLCLAPRPDGGAVCAGGDWQAQSGLALEGELRALDLQAFAPLLPETLHLTGRLGGKVSLKGPVDAPTLGAALRLPAGRLTLREAGERPITLALRDAKVDLHHAPDGLRASAALSLQDEGRMELHLEGRPQAGSDSLRLAGRLQAALPDLTLLAPLVPQARIRAGRMRLDARIAGTSRRPRAVGELRVIDGALDYPALGLEVREFSLALEGGEDGRLRLEASARSGPGLLRLAGEGALDPRAPWRLRIDGQRVQLVRLPDARVLASPALRLSGGAGGIEVTGRVEIPEAEIVVRELPEGVVRPSSDEVVVGSKQSEDKAGRSAPLDLSGRVGLVLGEKVRFAGFGLKTRVTGRLRVALAQGQTRVHGNLDLVEGRYRAWGQDLTIEQGRLLFAGPPDNPGIDLRAVRPSRDGKVKAYLAVSGTLRQPATRVYTEPPSSGTDALAYLLNGAPMGQSQGLDQAQLMRAAGSLGLAKTLPLLRKIEAQTGLDELGLDEDAGLQGSALAVGKYLTPDLYVRYVQGLFDPASVLSLRYRLSEHLSVETRSGTTQSAELIYSIEHD